MEKLHQQWDSIMNLYFYDFENLFSRYEYILEERRKAEEEEAKKQGYDGDTKYNPDAMMKQAQRSMPKMPDIKIPKF